MGACAAGCWLLGGVTPQDVVPRARGCRAAGAAPRPGAVTPPQLDAAQDASACSWVQGGCRGAGVQVGWEGASKTFLACCSRRGTRGMCLPAATLRKSAQYQGYGRQESFRRRHMLAFTFPGVIQKSTQSGFVCDVRGLRGTLKYSLLTHYSAPYCLLGLFLKNFWSE